MGERNVMQDVIFIIIIAVIALIITSNFAILNVRGNSMNPELHNKDILFMKKESSVKRDSIAIFQAPKSWSDEESKFIKRVIGIPGDIIEIKGNKMYRNKELIADITDKKCNLKKDYYMLVEKDEYFMVGDNYSSSNDGLSQICSGNEEITVNKKSIILSGSKMMKIER